LILYAATFFKRLSVFLVQPFLAKYILPGLAAVRRLEHVPAFFPGSADCRLRSFASARDRLKPRKQGLSLALLF
jgi:hypothetical protein